MNTYNRVAGYLNKVFKLINAEYFGGELEMPTITIQSTVGAYGHVTTSKVWTTDKGNASYELNIGADTLARPIENVVATLIHEACHLYASKTALRTPQTVAFITTNGLRLWQRKGACRLTDMSGTAGQSQAPQTKPFVFVWTMTCRKSELQETLS